MRQKDVYGVGIRGAGQVAYQHAEAVAANPRLHLAAVCSRTRESAEKLAGPAAPGLKYSTATRTCSTTPRWTSSASACRTISTPGKPFSRWRRAGTSFWKSRSRSTGKSSPHSGPRPEKRTRRGSAPSSVSCCAGIPWSSTSGPSRPRGERRRLLCRNRLLARHQATFSSYG